MTWQLSPSPPPGVAIYWVQQYKYTAIRNALSLEQVELIYLHVKETLLAY